MLDDCMRPKPRGLLSLDARIRHGAPPEGTDFFRSLVENLEMTLAKSSLEIATGYLELVEDPGLDEPIRAEHERTVASRSRSSRRASSLTATRSSSVPSASATRTSTR